MLSVMREGLAHRLKNMQFPCPREQMPVISNRLTNMDMNELTSMLKAGRYAELETQVREALRSQPDSGMLWKALSVSLSLQGRDALDASQRAATLLPDDVEAHANLGNALLRGARFDEAAASYRRALDIAPRLPEVCNNLGNALRGLGKPDAAAVCYARAIEQNPRFAEAYSNLGNALRSLGRLDQAVAHYRQALEIKPQYPEAWNNLGNVLLDLKQFADAATCYRSALALKADFAEAHSNLGNSLRALGQLEDAAASYGRALELKPDFAAAHSNLGDTLRDLGQSGEAAAHSRRATELAPALAGAHNGLANALLDLGKLDDAEAGYRRALALEPHFAEGWINLGLLLRQRGLAAEADACARRALEARADAAPALVLLAELRADAGDFAAAENLFQRAVALDPESPQGWAGMAHLRRMTESDAAWAVRALEVAGRGLPARQEVYLRFALGKYFDDVKKYPQAFENFQRAHQLLQTYGARYDQRQQALGVDRLIETHDAAWARGVHATPADSTRPVFIVGMPRSGTTLAEQILASHPAVFGAGELPFWIDATRGVPGQGATRVGAGYLELLQRLSADAERVIDKMPGNFWCLGAIHEALPNARIIHMQRDPVDTCLSIYFQHFKNALPYANDLRDLVHFHGEYQRLMSHWRATLPADVMLEVPYEGLVTDQEAWTRRMLRFIGLAWDSRCLDFHHSSRSVTTASKWQVRQKLNRSSIQRWKNYEPFIGPLATLLAPH
jgi:tetratricopeptide (TPR) repeat protein